MQNCCLWFPVLLFHLCLLLSYFFTYTYFSLTLLSTMHAVMLSPRDHLLQTLMLLKCWPVSSSLTTQQRTVPVSDSLRICTQIRDGFSKTSFCLIISALSLALVWGTGMFSRTQQSQEGLDNKNSSESSEYCFIQHSVQIQESAWSQSKHTLTFVSQNLFTVSVMVNLSFLSN